MTADSDPGDMEVLAQHWKLFRKHAPAGAYLPIGQLDGDCRSCGHEWPCPPIREVLAADRARVRAEVLAEAAGAIPAQVAISWEVRRRIGDWLRGMAEAGEPDA